MYLILVLYSLLICDKSQTPWSLYALLLATLSHSFITDPLLVFLLHRSTITLDPLHRSLSFCIFALWLLFTKVVKLLPHFVLYPADICFVPATILFGYCHGPIKFYAFLTLHVVSPRNVVLFDIILTISDYLGQSRGEQQREVGDVVLEEASHLAWSGGGSSGGKVLIAVSPILHLQANRPQCDLNPMNK